jgi:hypothetical protein
MARFAQILAHPQCILQRWAFSAGHDLGEEKILAGATRDPGNPSKMVQGGNSELIDRF